MQDFELDADMLLNPRDIIIPRGWTVLSHGTSFHKWESSTLTASAQDLKKASRITIHDTVNGGLTCFDEDNRYMPTVYAGQDEPVIFKVLVPADLKVFDMQIANEALRFIKPENLEAGVMLVPSGTELVKIGEDIADRPGDMSVIWYVPAQFCSLLKEDLTKLKEQKARRAAEQEIEVPIFDINASFAAAEEASNEEHILEQEEKADEYYEDLEEQQQELLDEEIAEEEKKAEKRAKDKARAREQDKKNFAATEAEHQKQMQEASEQNASGYGPGSSNDYGSTVGYDVSNPNTPYSVPYSYSDPYRYSGTEYEQPNYSEPQDNSSQQGYVSATDAGFVPERPSESTYESSPDGSVQPSAVYDKQDYEHQDRAQISESERRRRQFIEDDYELSRQQQKADAERFQNEMQAEAQRKQQTADNYTSFGHSGIDFSGKDNHSSYGDYGQSSSYADGSSVGPNGSSTQSGAETITTEALKKYEDDFHASRERFRSYSENVPDNVVHEYQAARDKYFSTQREIAAGHVVVTDSSSSGSNYNEPNTRHTTSQNTRAGADAPGRREAQILKDPPKSPVDTQPLTFSEDKFRSVRRFAQGVGDRSVRAFDTVKNKVLDVAASEESGTASTILSVKRGAGDIAVVLDCIAGGSGKKEAAKIWSQYVADANGTKFRGIDNQAIKDFGKLNLKTVDGKLTEALSGADLIALRNKFGAAADISVSDAVGTHNGKIGKRSVFADGKVNVRIAEGRIGSLRNQATNLKSQIKELQGKGAALSGVERQRLSDLMAKKNAVDIQLRNTVGATNVRHQTERLYRQINGMSLSKLSKEIKNLENMVKKGVRLNKTQLKQLDAMKERQAQMKMRNSLAGKDRFSRAKRLASLAGQRMSKLLRDSQDEMLVGFVGAVDKFSQASRFATNRYVRGALKWSTKMALKPARLAGRLARKADRKLGVSKAVGKAVSKPVNAATSRLLHTKPIEKLTSSRLHKFVKSNGGLRKSIKPGLKKLVPNKAKAAAKKVLDVFKRLNKNPAVKGVKAIFTAPFKGLKAINFVVNWVKSLIRKWIILPIVFLVLGAFIVTSVTSLILDVPASVFCGDDVDGRIQLTPYIKLLNEKQVELNEKIKAYKNDTEAKGGEYKNVYVNYFGGANSNNYREIISMAAVYFQQTFSNKEMLEQYILNLYDASNYVTTEESDEYFCSGCETRNYKCTDELDEYVSVKREGLYYKNKKRGGCIKYKENCEDGCKIKYCTSKEDHLMSSAGDCDNYDEVEKDGKTYYECLGHAYCVGHTKYKCDGKHSEKVCYGHIDLYVNVACLGFDKLFAVDPMTTIGLEMGNYKKGDSLGTFKITYYCAEKYPHICNAGPPYKTASGTTVTPGRTIAVDKSIIPLNTPVIINGHTYVAEDTGGAIKGNRIDIAVATHQEALNAGTDLLQVYAAVDMNAEEKEQAKEDVLLRNSGINYVAKAKEVATDDFLAIDALRCFQEAKDNLFSSVIMEPATDPNRALKSYGDWLQGVDAEHKNEPFTNAEINTFEYVKMSMKELKALAKERGLDADYDEDEKDLIIMEELIPYDWAHPDEYIIDIEKKEDQILEEYYFEGWTDENKEWAKTILLNMTSEIYAGLDEIQAGTTSDSLTTEGVLIEGNQIDVTYYSQHDPEWANVAIRYDYPQYTISTSGCGFTSMAIVVSSMTDKKIDPVLMCADYGTTFYSPGKGASWALVGRVSADNGLKCTEMPIDVQKVIDALAEGKLVVVSVGSGGLGYTGQGYYTGAGHFLVICGVTPTGRFILADPNNASISTSAEGVDMQYFLDSGIKTWWAISK